MIAFMYVDCAWRFSKFACLPIGVLSSNASIDATYAAPHLSDRLLENVQRYASISNSKSVIVPSHSIARTTAAPSKT
jgi:hypothetical protein